MGQRTRSAALARTTAAYAGRVPVTCTVTSFPRSRGFNRYAPAVEVQAAGS